MAQAVTNQPSGPRGTLGSAKNPTSVKFDNFTSTSLIAFDGLMIV